MYSSRRGKAVAKSSSYVQQNGGRDMDSSTTTLRSSQAGGCNECNAHEEQNTAFSEAGILPGEQEIRYSASDIENNSNTRVRICRHGYAEDDMQGSKDSGIAEDENNCAVARTMYSASEIASSSPHDEGVIHHQEELPGDINSGEDSGHAEYKQISSERKVYSALQSRDSNHGDTKMCRHGVITIDNRGTRDDDALSQESEEYKSYNEGNLTKTASYRNVTRLSQASSEDFRIELSENDEEALKEELLHIFERERGALEMYFRNKMEERLRGFRNRQIEFEEATRAEKVQLESSMSMEKMEMQKMFAEEIAKLTSSFNEERQQLEVYYKEQLKDLREQLRIEHKQMDEKFAREKMELKEKLEAEYETMIKRDMIHQKQEAAREKTELEARFHKEKLELEKSYNMRLTEAETSLQRLKAEFEANLANERMRMEKQNQVSIMEIDAKLQEEKRLRLEKERELEQDKANYVNEDSLKRKENERLKNDADALRREIDEKNRETLQLRSLEETVRTKGREGLEGKLRDDFEKLLADHKMELEKNFHRDKEKLDETLQSERRKMKEEQDQEKEAIKLEQDEIVKTKERLRSEEKAQTERQQQRSMEGEMATSSQYNRFEVTSRVPDRGMKQVGMAFERKHWETNEQEKDGSGLGRPPAFNNHIQLASRAAHPGLYQQQQEQHSGSPVAPYAIHSRTNDGLPQYPSSANLKDDSKCQPHYHATFEHHEKQEQPRKRSLEREPGAGSTLQSGQREVSVHFVSSENERALQSEILALKSENEGLKAKIAALEENIELHKKYKEEAKAEMERLLKGNQENEVTIQNLTLEVEKLKKLNAVEVNARPRDYGDRVKPDGFQDRMETANKNGWELDGRLKRLETRAVRAQQKENEFDADMRVVDERKKEKGRRDDSLDRWSIFRQKDEVRLESMPANDRRDSHYKAKYETTLREKNKLLQVTKELQMKIKTLQEKQSEILKHGSHIEKSSEKTEETERLKQLVSENMSLKQRTSELQNHLQRLLEKLKIEKQKASSLDTELSRSTHKSKSVHNIQDLQETLQLTGRELSGSRRDLDPDTLGRIEKEITTIGQIVKTQFGEGSMGHVSYRTTSNDVARVSQLEVEKKELEMKLKLAREAMSEYVTLLNDKMQDVKSLTGMSEEMFQELHTRNNSLKKSLQALEEGQKTSQLQNEQLRHQKAALQNLIGDLCREEEATGTSYISSSRFLDPKTEGVSEEIIGESHKTPSRHSDYKYESKYGGGYDNRYEVDFERGKEGKYHSKEVKEVHDGEKFSRGSKTSQYSVEFVGYPRDHSSFEYQNY